MRVAIYGLTRVLRQKLNCLRWLFEVKMRVRPEIATLTYSHFDLDSRTVKSTKADCSEKSLSALARKDRNISKMGVCLLVICYECMPR